MTAPIKSQNTALPGYSDQLLRRLYATLADDAHWPDVMETICFGFQACGTALVKHDFASAQGKIVFHCPHFLEAVHRHNDLFSRDPCLTSGTYFQAGSVMLGSELARLGSPVGEKICRDHFQELGIYHRLYGVLERSGTSAQFLFLGRSQSKPPFNAAEKRRLPQLLGHLGEVRHLGRSLDAKLFERHALIKLLDHIPFACVLVNQTGHIRFVNQAATELLSKEQELLIRSGRLCARTGNDSLRLWKAISLSAQATESSPQSTEQHLVLAGLSMPVFISVFSIGRDQLHLPQRPEDLVAIVTKDGMGVTFETIAGFAAAYGLSPPEERLVQLLASGHALFEAARQLGITKNTARTHMRHAYAKVQVHRQTDLLRLLSSIGAV
jgi:DNA-binding CsgD family transcriptional regulator/PAS domain-containing protein